VAEKAVAGNSVDQAFARTVFLVTQSPLFHDEGSRGEFFGDLIFDSGFDYMSSTIKARRAGFPDCIDTEDMFLCVFGELRRNKVIPEKA
jgi:hypothetical protein